METTSRRLRVKRGAEQWRVLLSRFDGSGLSVAEFCAREGSSDTSFHRWRSRLRAAGSSQPERALALIRIDPFLLTKADPRRGVGERRDVSPG